MIINFLMLYFNSVHPPSPLHETSRCPNWNLILFFSYLVLFGSNTNQEAKFSISLASLSGFVLLNVLQRQKYKTCNCV